MSVADAGIDEEIQLLMHRAEPLSHTTVRSPRPSMGGDRAGRRLRRRHVRHAAVIPGRCSVAWRGRSRHRIDRDPQAVAAAAADPAPRDRRALFGAPRHFSQMNETLAAPASGASTASCSTSRFSPQIDDGERGFSFPSMARSTCGGPTRGESAAEFLERADERQIAEVIRDYGEERLL